MTTPSPQTAILALQSALLFLCAPPRQYRYYRMLRAGWMPCVPLGETWAVVHTRECGVYMESKAYRTVWRFRAERTDERGWMCITEKVA